jgi:OOP family OmpA-OmpF porin
MSRLKSLLPLVALVPALSATAAEVQSDAGFSITPRMGYFSPGSDRELDDNPFAGIGIGYRFGTNWEVEASYLDANLDEDGRTFGDADMEGYHVDAIYNFTNTAVQPYLSIGYGELEYDYGNAEELEEEPFNIGVGVKWFMNQDWAIRSEIRGYDDSDTDLAISVGLHRLFGQTPPPPPDSDGDGVRDDLDQCPGTPRGVQVDAVGCPLDGDGDGVPDYLDQCPDTKPGYRVDEKGCYVELQENVRIELNVEFAHDSDVVEEQFKSEIARVAAFLREYHGTTADIEGHTDNTGTAEYNMGLSQRRAQSVVDVLVKDFDIDPARVEVEAFGQTRPIADNSTEEGRARNRRVVSEIEAEVLVRQKQ